MKQQTYEVFSRSRGVYNEVDSNQESDLLLTSYAI